MIHMKPGKICYKNLKGLNLIFSGTVNIHPSLLPLYRGAAPVQRALQVLYLCRFMMFIVLNT